MFRSMVWTLRQPRYQALAALMAVFSVGCVAAGTWQIYRFTASVRDNNALIGHAHAAATPLNSSIVPLVGSAPAPTRDEIRFRTVSASGTFLNTRQSRVFGQHVGGTSGSYLLTPLQTVAGVLLVVRGFIADDANGNPSTPAPPAPTGPVRIVGRLQTASTADDHAAQVGGGDVVSINPAEQSRRIGAPVFDAYVTLNSGQPGTAGLRVLPGPDLSNPAGGAYEAQHFAYILQWYLFAVLAVAAPFLIGRHEVKEAQRRFLGIDPGEQEFGGELAFPPEERWQLGDGLADGAIGAAIAVRADGTVSRRTEPSAEQWERAAHVADRYGRSLGAGHETRGKRVARPRRKGVAPALPAFYKLPDSRNHPHRADDAYQGTYNDYLWQLALADGEIPDVDVIGPPSEGLGTSTRPAIGPRIIEADPVTEDDTES